MKIYLIGMIIEDLDAGLPFIIFLRHLLYHSFLNTKDEESLLSDLKRLDRVGLNLDKEIDIGLLKSNLYMDNDSPGIKSWQFWLFYRFSKMILGHLFNLIEHFNLGRVDRLPGYTLSLIRQFLKF